MQKNLLNLKNELGADCQLMAVSKHQSADKLREAYTFGQREFGENQVQQMQRKSVQLDDLDFNFHFIGTLQSNKINQLLSIKQLVAIHSIDRPSLLKKILSKDSPRKIGLFLQINSSGEKEKGGFMPSDSMYEHIQSIDSHPHFFFQGFMTIGKIRTDDFMQSAHECFAVLAELKHKYGQMHKIELSMGMSQDYTIALKYGSNWVRIGSKIFGQRES